jgi:hypothetical protein
MTAQSRLQVSRQESQLLLYTEFCNLPPPPFIFTEQTSIYMTWISSLFWDTVSSLWVFVERFEIAYWPQLQASDAQKTRIKKCFQKPG